MDRYFSPVLVKMDGDVGGMSNCQPIPATWHGTKLIFKGSLASVIEIASQ